MSTPHDTNALGQPIGFELAGWTPPPVPPRATLQGRFCRVEPLDPELHVESLYTANRLDADGRMWTYMSYGPFDTLESYLAWVRTASRSIDPQFYAIVDIATSKAVGVASYLRIDPAAGSIEVGNLAYSPLLQRKPAATEAMFLMMRNAFELGYRRYEWKCNSLNAPSRAAAQRLGFTYEGTFRQHYVHKGRSRDSAWFSIIDREWPALKDAYLRWLDSANFDTGGGQKTRLSDLTRDALEKAD